MKRFPLILMVFLLWAWNQSVYGASYQCKEYSGRKGSVTGAEIDLGTIIYTDGSHGWKTYVKWPGKFDVPTRRTTWDKDSIVTPAGSIILKCKMKLAGIKKWGFWLKKENEIHLRLKDANGNVLAEKTITKKVRSPKTYTVTLPSYNPGATPGNTNTYTVEIEFDKKDGNGGDDGTCTYEFSVRAN